MTLEFGIRKPRFESLSLLNIYLFTPFSEKEGFEVACSEGYTKIEWQIELEGGKG